MAERDWILLNPGPANTTSTVRKALVMPDLCHREPECFEMMRRCREELVRLSGAGDDFAAVLFAGSGTAAVEAAVIAAVPAHRTLLVVDNGVYGDRIRRIASAHGIPTVAVTADPFRAVHPADVEAVLRVRPDISHVALVHHETTTGVLNPVADVARITARYGCRLIVDAMSSLFGEPLDVPQEPIDFVAASANKCLQGVPGVAFVLARRSTLATYDGQPPRSVYLDLYGHYVSQERDNTPFTPAVQVLHAMEQALSELAQETLEGRIRRYRRSAGVLREGMEALGFEILVSPAERSQLLTTFRLPPGVTYAALHDAMKRRGYIVYAGQGNLGTYAFRVANMGTLTAEDMTGVVTAFAAVLQELGVRHPTPPERLPYPSAG